jgi:predicted regulator of Ras-like GTPase activity (Roadblock/LC7/MglB family)
MPKARKNVVYLALSPAATAHALGLSEQVVRDAIANDELGPLYVKGTKTRLLVSDIETWVRSWPKKSKGVSR